MHMRTSWILITTGLAGVIFTGMRCHTLMLNLQFAQALVRYRLLNRRPRVLGGLAFATDSGDNSDDAQAVLTQTRTLFNPYIGATIESILGVGSDGMTTFLLNGDEAWDGTTCA
jgi:hypothetical protein